MRSNDVIHFGLMPAVLAAGRLVPFELLPLAHVVPRPRRYITETSWLHDRSHLLPHRCVATALAVLAVIAAPISGASWFGLAIWASLAARAACHLASAD